MFFAKMIHNCHKGVRIAMVEDGERREGLVENEIVYCTIYSYPAENRPCVMARHLPPGDGLTENDYFYY
jgi:hypothetical protein